MKKLSIILIFLIILLTSCGLIYNLQFYDEQQTLNIDNNCPNFDGKEFLLSGGTGTPQTIEEIYDELIRLNSLCRSE